MDFENRLLQLEDKLREHQHSNVDGTLPLQQSSFVTVNLPDTTAQTSTNYGMIFTATRPCYVRAISEKHAVAGSDAGAVTLDVTRLQGTTALGSGTSLLKTTFNLKGTAYTTQRAVMADLKTTASLVTGDSLALKVTGTLTALKGVQVTLELSFI